MSETSLKLHESDFSPEARNTIEYLEKCTRQIAAKVEHQSFWKTLISPDTSEEQVRGIFRELFLEIYSYQRHTTEAGFLMIGRLPKSEYKLISVLTHHKAEEAEHGEWALRDYLLLGGREELTKMPTTPAAFAVASIWWRMALVEDPFGYLGAEYLFEYLTAIVSGRVMEGFSLRGFKSDGFGFIVAHATEDVKHTNLFRHLVGYTVTKFPESRHAMSRCFDYFAHVYPVPVWAEAFERTRLIAPEL